VAEVDQTGIPARADVVGFFPEHAIIVFSKRPQEELRKIARRLRDFAEARGGLYPNA